MMPVKKFGQSKFQSTLPAGEATTLHDISCIITIISIHASRGGSDINAPSKVFGNWYFNPRFPRGKRPHRLESRLVVDQFQSTLPAGEATCHHHSKGGQGIFQSTLPAGEATGSSVVHPRGVRDFNPRFPRGKRQDISSESPTAEYFNPRFPRGKRPVLVDNGLELLDFNPRFPRGKRPARVPLYRPTRAISIHASRGGSDNHGQPVARGSLDFNPRFPRGKRPRQLAPYG